jgi:immune inhibitor A
MRTTIVIVCLSLLLLSSCASGSTDATISQSPVASVAVSPTPFTPTPLPASPPESLSDLLATEQLLLTAPYPVSDPYSLARRLKLHTVGPISHTVRTTPLNAHVGQEDSFWIENADSGQYSRVRARLVSVTPHLYMYVEDGQSVNLSAIAASASTFETKIYPTDRAALGSEWTPGIDDDVHITVLNAAGLGTNVGGAFAPGDEYPASVSPYSNEREMLYLNLDSLLPGTTDYDAALTAEFARLIDWHQQPGLPAWINEGVSLLAEHLNGYAVDAAPASFLQAFAVQLTSWSDDPAASLAHYGASYLFMDYFATHYGLKTLRTALQDPAPPPQNFSDALAKSGYTVTFPDVLAQWLIANYAQSTLIDNGVYGYPDLTLPPLTPQHTVSSFPFTENDLVAQYGAQYYVLPPTHRGSLEITLQGSPTVRMISNVPFDEPDEWWSNQYDHMDSTLTRSFDLSHVKGKHAALQFAAWFDLAPGNAAYVEASTDGKNWTPLPGLYTTKTTWGSGYTGTSGGLPTPQWVQESVNLSRYIGKRVWLRFETITARVENGQGFALDALSIPAIHFVDNVAADNGWVSNGFIRSNNVLPQHFNVQALLYHGTQFTVSAMHIDPASEQGQLTIPDTGPNITRVVLIVSAYAAQTTLPASYQLQMTVI